MDTECSGCGRHTLTLHVADSGNGDPGRQLDDVATVTVVVRATNSAPQLAAIGTLTVDEGQSVVMTPEASDPDGDSLTWSIDGLPDGVAIDPFTGRVNWRPTFEQAGVYAVQITVSDGQLARSEDLTLQVNDVNGLRSSYRCRRCWGRRACRCRLRSRQRTRTARSFVFGRGGPAARSSFLSQLAAIRMDAWL